MTEEIAKKAVALNHKINWTRSNLEKTVEVIDELYDGADEIHLWSQGDVMFTLNREDILYLLNDKKKEYEKELESLLAELEAL